MEFSSERDSTSGSGGGMHREQRRRRLQEYFRLYEDEAGVAVSLRGHWWWGKVGFHGLIQTRVSSELHVAIEG
ncbi:hypothetical protein F2Q69_00027730 [Brassica cretica]|uniref:Uncharacterized protein n=1 Tax=Brassica cretica TaxID=69181 RepID=A0A8S9RZC2_BRACR|nr:hypothetical protein F2Q69_00027730 [Brassica cretica]